MNRVAKANSQWAITCVSVLVTLFPHPALHGQFYLNGDAVQLNDTCYQLTEDRMNSAGSIWNESKLDLSHSFELLLEVNLGCRDFDGADGMVLAFQPDSAALGGVGEGIGFSGISPSLGIELDTWENSNLADPGYDHMAIIRNGNVGHNLNTTLAGPIVLPPGGFNAEDCSVHLLRVVWDADAMLLEAYFDCVLRLSYAGDIVNDIFSGDPEVLWGLTSATGGAFNIHKVCLTHPQYIDKLKDITLCPGGQVRLRASEGSTYRWQPAEGLSDPRVSDPVASPARTTRYEVSIHDQCGREFIDSLTVFVEGDSLIIDLGPDLDLCMGESVVVNVSTPEASYLWNDGLTQPRRHLADPGMYEVFVTRNDSSCMVSDAIHISQVPDPRVVFLSKDTSGCFGETILLRPFVQGGMPTWPDGSSQDSFEVSQAGLVYASVVNACGMSEDWVEVAFSTCDHMYVPTAFSPNGDGVNDGFTVFGEKDIELVELFQVFNRWGELVFSAGNFFPGDGAPAWDGRFRNQEAPIGTYIYQVKAQFRNGSTQVRSGTVVLLR